ncbi:hypothetical protein EPIB1_1466 [Tritonibacter mobilis]|nr:hypothetical protein EPIB1_1466 [Tritonibacter mobilis]
MPDMEEVQCQIQDTKNPAGMLSPAGFRKRMLANARCA